MEIERIVSGLTESLGTQSKQSQGFAEILNQGIESLSQLENKSDEMADRLAAGEDVELHDVMVASQEADVAVRLATQLRTQVLGAYNEVMKMPV